MARVPVVNWSKGELGPQLYSRIDAGQYASAGKRLRNIVVQRYGGAAARPGLRMIAPLEQQDKPARLVPFQYSIEQAYVLGMQDATAAPLAFGGRVLEQNTKITAITQTNPATVTAPLHGYTTGDTVYFSGITGMAQMNGQSAVVTVIDANTFSTNVDASTFAVFTGSDGTLNAAPPPTPTPTPTPTPAPTPTPPPSTGGGGGSGGNITRGINKDFR